MALLGVFVLSVLLFCVPAFARIGWPCHSTSFDFPDFSKNLHSLSLLGDAHVQDALVQVSSGSEPLKSGAVFYSRPVHLNRSPSFSSSFSFSRGLPQEGGLAFVVSRRKDFHPWADPFGLDISKLAALVSASNVSSGRSEDSRGDRLVAWIDYLAPARTLEVRVAKSHEHWPQDPIMSYGVEIPRAWRQMFVGLSSSNADSPQKHVIYSWKFSSGSAGKNSASKSHYDLPSLDLGPAHDAWLDSMSDIWRIAISLLFGAVCGGVTALIVLTIWSLLQWLRPSAENDTTAFVYGYQALPELDEQPGSEKSPLSDKA